MGSVESPPAIASANAETKTVAEHVQHACTSGFTGIARVTVIGDVGYWYFRRGEIIHALTLDRIGEEAALAMLGWDDGQWERCTRPWPSEQSVFLTWVELFQRAGERQRAAHAHAHALASSSTTHASFPPVHAAASTAHGMASVHGVASAHGAASMHGVVSTAHAVGSTRSVTYGPSASAPASLGSEASEFPEPRSQRSARLSLAPPLSEAPPREPPLLSAAQLESLAEHATDFVVVESDGRTRALRGQSEALSELTSYVSQLCDGIGAELGSGRCHALEVAYRSHTLFVASRGTNTLGLLVPRVADLDLVKAKLRA